MWPIKVTEHHLTTEKATSSPASNKDCFVLLHKGVAQNFNQKATLTELEWTDRLWGVGGAFKSTLGPGPQSVQTPFSWDICTRRTHILMPYYVRGAPAAAAGFHFSSEALCKYKKPWLSSGEWMAHVSVQEEIIKLVNWKELMHH